MNEIILEKAITIVILIVCTYSIKKMAKKTFNKKLTKPILSIIPLILAVAYMFINPQDLTISQKIFYGLGYGAVASSFYGIVIKKITKRLEGQVGSILGNLVKK